MYVWRLQLISVDNRQLIMGIDFFDHFEYYCTISVWAYFMFIIFPLILLFHESTVVWLNVFESGMRFPFLLRPQKTGIAGITAFISSLGSSSLVSSFKSTFYLNQTIQSIIQAVIKSKHTYTLIHLVQVISGSVDHLQVMKFLALSLVKNGTMAKNDCACWQNRPLKRI
jgi:hypothetical protein